jgi:hypothetical protein
MSGRDEQHRTGGEEGQGTDAGREAVAVDEGFLDVGWWNEDKCHRPSISSNLFFRFFLPIIQLRPKKLHSRHQVSLRRPTMVTISKKYKKN